MRTPILTIFAVAVCLQAFGQRYYDLGVFVGASNYAGDLVASLSPRFEENGLGVGLVGRTSLNSKLNLRGNFFMGTLSGDDFNYADRQGRGLKFESSLTEITAMVEWEPFGRKRFYTDARGKIGMNNIISPYFFTGMGLGFVQYDVDYSRLEDKSLEPKVEEDESFGSSNTFLSLPLGVGVKFDLIPRLVLGLEIGGRYPFSDYIDGISAAGNSESRDWYYFVGGTVSYRFLSGLQAGSR